MNVEVLLPAGQLDTVGRTRVREWVAAKWATDHPDYTITVATCPTPVFSKGAAVNRLLAASDADVLIVADSDSYTTRTAITRAVEQATEGSGWSVPFTLVKRIVRGDTERILDGHTVPRPGLERQARALPGGGIVVASKATWGKVNGIDPRFAGWGGEDACLGMALRGLAGPPATPDTPTVLWHLWHPGTRRPSPAANELWNRYRRARRQPDGLAQMVTEWEMD